MTVSESLKKKIILGPSGDPRVWGGAWAKKHTFALSSYLSKSVGYSGLDMIRGLEE